MNGRRPGRVVAVVDDDPSILRSLECLLESADYAARPFTGATNLLNSSALWEIDCLIFTKPFQGDALLAAVADALRGSGT
jgi:DNA-binding response OmpR family regulator